MAAMVMYVNKSATRVDQSAANILMMNSLVNPKPNYSLFGLVHFAIFGVGLLIYLLLANSMNAFFSFLFFTSYD